MQNPAILYFSLYNSELCVWPFPSWNIEFTFIKSHILSPEWKSTVPNVFAEGESLQEVITRLFFSNNPFHVVCPSANQHVFGFCSCCTCVSPLDLPYLFTQPGEVLCELHHHDDEGPPCEHAGGPEQRVEDNAVVVQPGQKHRLLLLAGVVIAGDLLAHLQPLRDVHDHGVHGHGVLLTPGHVETLQG